MSVLFDDYVTTASLIWGATEEFGLLDEVLTPPPEKFEDKDTDELATRMRPLETLLSVIGADGTRDEIIDEMVAEFAADVVGDEEVVQSEWRPPEQEFLDRATDFFATESWTFRKSSSRTAAHAADDDQVGIAA